MIAINLLSTELELRFGVDDAPNIQVDRKRAGTIHPTTIAIGAYDGVVCYVRASGWTVRKDRTFGAHTAKAWGRYEFSEMPDWLRNIVADEASRRGIWFEAVPDADR